MASADSIPSEVWLPVLLNGCETDYSVSSLGRVRRDVAAGHRSHAGKILKPCLTERGYGRVSLSSGTGRHTALIHRLVMAAFVGPCPAGKQVNHKNGNKLDNSVGNLEYVTDAYNHYHRYEILGLTTKGERHGKARLTNEDVLEIRRLRSVENKVPMKELAARFGVTKDQIKNIVRRRCWSHI